MPKPKPPETKTVSIKVGRDSRTGRFVSVEKAIQSKAAVVERIEKTMSSQKKAAMPRAKPPETKGKGAASQKPGGKPPAKKPATVKKKG